MGLGYIVRVTFRYKYVITVVFLLVNMISVFIGRSLIPKFESTAWILVDAGRILQPGVSKESNEVLRPEQVIRTQVSIITSEPVLTKAAAAFGFEKLFQSPDGTSLSLTALMLAIRGALVVSYEQSTDLVKVAFRHTDPAIAEQFTNEIVKVYLERHAALYGNPDAAGFFAKQGKIYEDELTMASAALEDFIAKTGTYSVDEQQKIYLSRRDQSSALLAETQSKIEGAQAQLNSIRYQLSVLKSRISLPPEIFGAVPSFGRAQSTSRLNDALWTDPPLLHVKLYQETAQKLVDANIELAGLLGTQERQEKEILRVDKQLRDLAQREPVSLKLRRAVEEASANANLYRRKIIDARTDAAWRSNEGLSSVHIMQSAGLPLRAPPNPLLVYALGGIMSVLLSFLTVLAMKYSASHDERVSTSGVGQAPSLEEPENASSTARGALDLVGQPKLGVIWKPISEDAQSGERILVAGGTYVRGNTGAFFQAFPTIVSWDGAEWVVCDNEGPKSVIRHPRFWCEIFPGMQSLPTTSRYDGNGSTSALC